MLDTNKLKNKLLRKLKFYLEDSELSVSGDGTIKKAFIQKSFQVLGLLFNVELVYSQRIELVQGEFTIFKEQYMIVHNSRSFQGGFRYSDLDDIGKILYLTKQEIIDIFKPLEEHSRFTKSEIARVEEKILSKIKKSANKILT